MCAPGYVALNQFPAGVVNAAYDQAHRAYRGFSGKWQPYMDRANDLKQLRDLVQAFVNAVLRPAANDAGHVKLFDGQLRAYQIAAFVESHREAA